jgi:dihydropteroate synthase
MAKASASEAAVRGTVPTVTDFLGKPFAIMGIVNVTPDSFYDGGAYLDGRKAIDHACLLADEGADIIDIGGHSTRPGAAFLSVEEECGRIVPVIEAVVKKLSVPVSVDTFNARTASAAFEAGASIINDISAGRLDATMKQFAAQSACPVILMHSRQSPLTMQDNPAYGDVVAEVKRELLRSVKEFRDAGVAAGNIIIDPGIGFAKRYEDNMRLLVHLDELVATGYPVCVGTSRKSFIGRLSGKGPESRLPGSLASIVPAFYAGVKLFRVHDAGETAQFLKVVHALRKK